MQMLFQFYQLLAFTFLQSRDGNVRPARDDLGNVLLSYFFAKQCGPFTFGSFCRGIGQFLFEFRNAPILNFTCLCQLTSALWDYAVAAPTFRSIVESRREDIHEFLGQPGIFMYPRRQFGQCV